MKLKIFFNFFLYIWLRTTRGTRNSNLQVVFTHASHVCSQHCPLGKNGMHRTQFDHSRLDLVYYS